jgi:hypothetical protein
VDDASKDANVFRYSQNQRRKETKMKKYYTVESHYGNLKDVRVLAEQDGGNWVIPDRTLQRINRNGAGDYYDRVVEAVEE